ncbi:MAG: YncE family protein [Tannerellaceae bacterium]|nr:YncE family protein [Tannerellaceae bacterium]
MDYGPLEEEDFFLGHIPAGDGVFVVNEGNFGYSTASLSYYTPSTGDIEHEVFIRSNGIPLGDVAQSMAIKDGRGFVVVNNSSVIYVMDLNTFKVRGKIYPFTSPRYIHFLSNTKAYVTDLYDPRISIINPDTYEITGHIDMNGHASTEQMVQYDKYVFTNCWSYDNKILVIDTEQDLLVDSIEVGIQPTSLVIDKYNKIWTVTDGGYEGSPYGYTAPSLYRIDAETRQIEQEFTFRKGEHPSEICLNGTRDTLYFINNSIWRMEVTADLFPARPFIEPAGTIYYGLAVNPVNSDVYVADAIDYVQLGVVYRYSSQGNLLDHFRAGIIPGAFCFR